MPGRSIEDFTWCHPIEINGVTTPGFEPLDYLQWKASAIPADLRGLRVLDVGCKDGYHSFLCEERGASVVAIDNGVFAWVPGERPLKIMPELPIQFAIREKRSSVEFFVCDARRSAELGQFDLILLFDVYYHMIDAPREMSEMLRALKPGGTLLLSGLFSDGASWQKRLGVDSFTTGTAPASLETMCGFLRSQDLTVIGVHPRFDRALVEARRGVPA